MRKIMSMLIFISLVILVPSCKKEEPETNSNNSSNNNSNCTCGTITADGIDGSCYWLEVKNSCSNNIKRFCFEQDVWMNNYVGDNFCVYNVNPW